MRRVPESVPLPPAIDERPASLVTRDGLLLEARVHVPAAGVRGRAAVCHPHPLYGGTMDNKVVAIAARAAAASGLVTVRFDFRGVGRSQGVHDDGRGEKADVAAALTRADELAGSAGRRVLIGYSFGSAVSTNAVLDGETVDLLVLIAPPLGMYALAPPAVPPLGLWVIVGDDDAFCPPRMAEAFVARCESERAQLRLLPRVAHSFDGGLNLLAAALGEALGP